MITKIIALIVVLIAIPYCIGLLPASFIDEDRRNIPTVYVMGFIVSLALFELVTVPVIICKGDGFPLVVGIYLGVESFFAMAGVITYNFMVRSGRGMTASPEGESVRPKRRKRLRDRDSLSNEEKILWALAMLAILFQMFMFIFMQSFDGDDAYYVVQSLLTNETDTLYRIKPYTGLTTSMDLRHALASMPVWIAYLARVSGIHSTIIAHSVIGIVLIPLIYMIYYCIANVLFASDIRRTAIFILFVSFINIFGNVSIYTTSTFLLTRTWQGKAMLANLVLGSIIWLMIAIFKVDEDKDEEEPRKLGYWIVLFMLSIVAAMCSTASVFLVAIFIGIYGVVMSISKRDIQIALRLMITCVPLVAYGALYLLM